MIDSSKLQVYKPNLTLRITALLAWLVTPFAIWFYATFVGLDGGLVIVSLAGVTVGAGFWLLGGIIRS